MDFICPTCEKAIPYDLKVIVSHTDEHIIEVIKKLKPNWKEEDGVCKKCYEYYINQLHGKE